MALLQHGCTCISFPPFRRAMPVQASSLTLHAPNMQIGELSGCGRKHAHQLSQSLRARNICLKTRKQTLAIRAVNEPASPGLTADAAQKSCKAVHSQHLCLLYSLHDEDTSPVHIDLARADFSHGCKRDHGSMDPLYNFLNADTEPTCPKRRSNK